MRKLILSAVVAGLLLQPLNALSQLTLSDILRGMAPSTSSKSHDDEDEDSSSLPGSLAVDLSLGLALAGLGTVTLSTINQSVVTAVTHRGEPAGDKALASLRSWLSLPSGMLRRFVRVCLTSSVSDNPANAPNALAVAADLGLQLPASVANTEVTLPASASKLSWTEFLRQCQSPKPREMAQLEAHAWAGLDANSIQSLSTRPWSELRPPRGMSLDSSLPFAQFRQFFPADMVYQYFYANGASVTEHPLGHLDQPGPSWHLCPHFHAFNSAGVEKIIEYGPIPP